VHPTQNAILVMADEAGVARVRELVNLFDVKANIGPLRIQLEVADASEVVSTVTLVLGGVGGGGGPKGAAPSTESFQLVPDPSGSAIWYHGSESDLEKVRSLITTLDVAGSAPSLHIVHLVYQLPSFVADILRQFDGVAPQAAEPAPAGAKPKTRRAKSTHTASKFTPDDSKKLLYILCNADDFARYQEIITKLDQPENEKDFFVRVPIKHLESNVAADKLGIMVTSTTVNQDVRIIAVDGAILLVGASPSDVAIINSILAEVDKPSTIEHAFVITCRPSRSRPPLNADTSSSEGCGRTVATSSALDRLSTARSRRRRRQTRCRRRSQRGRHGLRGDDHPANGESTYREGHSGRARAGRLSRRTVRR
jgi:hypothetical protein